MIISIGKNYLARVVSRVCIFFCLLAIATSGCSSHRVKLIKPVQLATVRPPGFQLKTVPMTIAREDLRKSVANTNSLRKIRLVKILTNAQDSGKGFPEYRLFGIQNDSPYTLLGLRNSDILVAANDYVLFNPDKFMVYVSLLPKEQAASIEIRRDAEPIVFRYDIVDAAASAG